MRILWVSVSVLLMDLLGSCSICSVWVLLRLMLWLSICSCAILRMLICFYVCLYGCEEVFVGKFFGVFWDVVEDWVDVFEVAVCGQVWFAWP